MKSLNRVELIGNVGREPEQRSTGSGVHVTRFSVATTDRIKKGEQFEDVTEWHNCVAWGPVADVVRDNVKKGDRLYVAGKNKTDKWVDDAGTNRERTNVVVDDLIFLSPKPQAAQPAQDTQQQLGGGQAGGSRSRRGAK